MFLESGKFISRVDRCHFQHRFQSNNRTCLSADHGKRQNKSKLDLFAVFEFSMFWSDRKKSASVIDFRRCRTGIGRRRTWGPRRRRRRASISPRRLDIAGKASGSCALYFDCQMVLVKLTNKHNLLNSELLTFVLLNSSYPDSSWSSARHSTWATTRWPPPRSTITGSTCFTPSRISQNLWVSNTYLAIVTFDLLLAAKFRLHRIHFWQLVAYLSTFHC